MKNKLFYYIGVGLAAVSMTGCNLDINSDPYAVTSLDMSQLLTAAEWETGVTFAGGYYLNANFSAYVHHTVSREVDNYALVSNYSTLGNTWEQAYRYAIKNCDALISNGDESGDAILAGIGRVLRTYVYMSMTDLWGDVPYSEANVNGIESPKADKSADIYNALIASLNKAVENFNDTEALNPNEPGKNDLFYNGDVDLWIKAANTLKLKMLVQSRLAKSEVTGWKAELDALIAEDNFLEDGEDLQFPHTTTKMPQDERNATFIDEYEGGQKTVYISPWFYEVLNGKDYNFKNNPFKDVVDPRVPYYYVNQLTEFDAAQNRTDYRDGGFVSIVMGSNSGLSGNTQEKSMSCLGIYPVGGKYDDGNGCVIGASSGIGVAPDKMLQAYSVPFMKAELVLAGELTGDAADLLGDGIQLSLNHVNAITAKCDPTAPLISDDEAATFIGKIMRLFNAGNDAKKMEILMTQKWIANFFNPVEAYSDIRRTGYPYLFTGEDNTAYTPYAQEEEPTPGLASFTTTKILDFPRIMWYPDAEVNVNKNITNVGRIVSQKYVFWDK